MLTRLIANLFSGWFRLSRWFPADRMRHIRDAIAAGERGHAGELCLAVESRYSPWAVLGGLQPRERAQQLFSLLRVWDTQANSGVLLYLQLAERRVEIVADRGISERVAPEAWQAPCADFAREVAAGGAHAAGPSFPARLNALPGRPFPAADAHPPELPDDPVVL